MNSKPGFSALGATLLLALAGCGSGSKDASTSGKPGKQIVLGFSQIGAESGWRTANTNSIKSAAKAAGIDLKFTDAQGKQEKQIKDIKDFIAQGVDVIAFSPIVEQGFGPVLQEAKRAHIPVIVSDRRPDVPDDLYVTFIGSDFVEEGKRAGQWLADKTGGKATIAELTGTTGSAPANDRAKGFRDAISKYPGMKIVYSETGDFKRALGKQAMEAYLKNPASSQITAVFSHNDDMAIGAIQAMEEAGRKPGKDILVVSVDGLKDYFQEIVDGKANCVVECNPLLGPQLMDIVKDVVAGKTEPKRIVTKDGIFDQTSAAKELPNRKY